jgi:hypothetical protein
LWSDRKGAFFPSAPIAGSELWFGSRSPWPVPGFSDQSCPRLNVNANVNGVVRAVVDCSGNLHSLSITSVCNHNGIPLLRSLLSARFCRVGTFTFMDRIGMHAKVSVPNSRI